MKDQRLRAAQRRRRIIFNNDGNDIQYAAAATPEALLRPNTTGLLGSHVDSIFYCTNHGFNLHTHDTKVSETAYQTGAGSAESEGSRTIMKGLLEQGTDPLRVMCSFCRGHDLEIFWSFRINDEHASWIPHLVSQYVRDHPDHLLGTFEQPPPRGPWCGVDYAVPAVRDHALAIFEEVCHGYDIDGIELDFFRQLICFRKVAWDGAAGQDERDMMTDLLRRLRAMMDKVAAERGRPLLIAVRVPDSVEYCRDLGFDLMTWLREDLIDVMVAGGYFWLNPWQTTVTLAHEHSVPVYPSLDGSRITADQPREIRRSDEAYRAHAAQAFHAGCDGVYLFNFNYFRSPGGLIWRQLGEPGVLAGLDKVYHVSVMGRGHNSLEYYLPDGLKHMNLPTLCPDHPLELTAGQSHQTTLTVADAVGDWPQLAAGPYVQLDVRAEHVGEANPLVVKLNGNVLQERPLTWYPRDKGIWCEFAVDPSFVKQGVNDLTFRSDAVACVLHDVQLRIDYGLNGERRRDITQGRGRYIAHDGSMI